MTDKSKQPRLNKLTIRLLTASSSSIGIAAGIYFGGLMFLIATITSIISKDPPQNLGLFIIIVFVITMLGGLVFGKTMAHFSAQQKSLRDEAIGLKLSSKDIIELTIWFKHGIKPKSKHLQPVLNNYLDYLEDSTKGKYIPRRRYLRSIGLVLFGITILSDILIIILKHKVMANNIFNLIVAIIIFSFYASVRPGRSSRLLSLLGTRQLKKIERMRGNIGRRSKHHGKTI